MMEAFTFTLKYTTWWLISGNGCYEQEHRDRDACGHLKDPSYLRCNNKMVALICTPSVCGMPQQEETEIKIETDRKREREGEGYYYIMLEPLH